MESGLVDPVTDINMAATAEVCAQTYSVSREAQDDYAAQSYRRCLEAQGRGFYASHVAPVVKEDRTVLGKDEYPFLRQALAEKPKMLSKAPLIFDSSAYTIKDFYRDHAKFIMGKTFEEGKSRATVSLFNACSRSDGAAVLIVASAERARDLGLEVLGEIVSWGFHGYDPAYMGIAPVFAAQSALERACLSLNDMGQIELHEAFAATCLSIFRVGKEKFNQDWQTAWDRGLVNPNGGTLALGHPLAATGARLLLNLLYSMKENPELKIGLATACASGGLGGAMILRRPAI
jgi:acetyl-CoA C-acetyltransferase